MLELLSYKKAIRGSIIGFNKLYDSCTLTRSYKFSFEQPVSSVRNVSFCLPEIRPQPNYFKKTKYPTDQPFLQVTNARNPPLCLVFLENSILGFACVHHY